MFNTCALTEAGTVKCWGDNRDGQLGDGTTEEHHTPVDVIGLPGGVIAIACGGAYWDSAYIHSCALTDSGRVKCWGSNGYLQLGNGDSYSYNHPMDVHALDPDIQFVAPGFEHTCAVTASGGAKCWGDNGSGQLGNATHTDTSLPVDVIGLSSSVKAITAGSYHTCALIGSGQAMCWGSNNYGQLGDGSGSNSPTPVNVYGLDHGVTAVSGGFGHTCAITYLGGVKCWGDNDRGQLGDGTELKQLTPVDVTGLTTGVKAIALGYEHTCALTTNGGVKCWGHNYYGQLGDGTTTDRSTPVDVSGLTSDVTAITTGFNHTCALTSSGKVKCWGYNVEGQLGDRTTTNRSTPVTVNDLTSGIAAITAGGLHTCAMTTYGRVCCWGGNGDGQLGDGSFIEKLTPVTVGGLASGASAIAAGVGYTCTLAGQGRLKCWGSDFSGIVDSPAGQLGLGRIAISSVPVDVVTDEPWLSTNYQAGRPGSFFTLTGQNFPPGGLATITINGQVRFPPMGVDESGWLVFFVDSVGATSGTHTVRVDVSPSTNASTSFELDEGAPWRVQEGGGVKFFLMGGSNRLTFLPVVKR
jgi:alpha-tubulin suppressor-like RCC1 family protein